uniref:Uncharacterized protein n=1 Tax=Meloidogyne enterolobii TaxID=390850 RepID=A0A6V7VC08_MELEN|nr:unnamed protein product [Meloidogyne enterolobii]
MFSIFWLNSFLIFCYILLYSNGNCMQKFVEGESNPQQNYDEGSSSSSIPPIQQIQLKTDKGKKILIVTDAHYSSYNFFLTLANVLCHNGKYNVIMERIINP